MDNLVIKYGNRDDIGHLLGMLKQHYDIEVDWKGALYCGITLNWNYEQKFVDLSMPNYVHKVLKRYHHLAPRRKQDCPYQLAPQQYGPQAQILPQEKSGMPLNAEGEQYIRQVVGSLLYYARAVDLTVLFALSAIAQEQANSTDKTMQRVKQLLDYMHFNPMAQI